MIRSGSSRFASSIASAPFVASAQISCLVCSSSIRATQVSALNDRQETKYATDLFKSAIERLIEEKKDDETARTFLHKVLEFIKENPAQPTHGTSKFFVACFSGEESDLNQWTRYGKKNGYAIGFMPAVCDVNLPARFTRRTGRIGARCFSSRNLTQTATLVNFVQCSNYAKAACFGLPKGVWIAPLF
jgi:hypothetical protein